MSDYISKSALMEILRCYEIELREDRKEAIETDDEMMLFAIANQETAISRIKRSVMYKLQAVDEKEILRKPMERIVERLGELKHDNPMVTSNYILRKDAIEIVKEEGGV